MQTQPTPSTSTRSRQNHTRREGREGLPPSHYGRRGEISQFLDCLTPADAQSMSIQFGIVHLLLSILGIRPGMERDEPGIPPPSMFFLCPRPHYIHRVHPSKPSEHLLQCLFRRDRRQITHMQVRRARVAIIQRPFQVGLPNTDSQFLLLLHLFHQGIDLPVASPGVAGRW